MRLIDADILRNKLLEAKDDEDFVLSPHLMLLWLDLMPSVGDDSTGVWLKTSADNYEVRKCSACHKTIWGRMQKAYAYCPHCGFRMVGDIDY